MIASLRFVLCCFSLSLYRSILCYCLRSITSSISLPLPFTSSHAFKPPNRLVEEWFFPILLPIDTCFWRAKAITESSLNGVCSLLCALCIELFHISHPSSPLISSLSHPIVSCMFFLLFTFVCSHGFTLFVWCCFVLGCVVIVQTAHGLNQKV